MNTLPPDDFDIHSDNDDDILMGIADVAVRYSEDSHETNESVRIFSSPLTVEDGDNLVLNYLTNTPVFPGAPWFSYLLVNENVTRGAHTVIDTSQWPFKSVREYNQGGHQRPHADEDTDTDAKNSQPHGKQSKWLLAQIIGPLPGKQDAVILNRLWEEKSRGAIPRAAKAEVLADHFNLGVYVDFDAIFRKST